MTTTTQTTTQTKTIHLNSEMHSYRLVDGIVQVLDVDPNWKCEKWITNESGEDVWNTACDWPDMTWQNSAYQIGAECVLICITDVSPNALRRGASEHYELRFDCADGVAGNSNRNIKRFHGWRGTTNDRSVCAYGLRKIIKICTLKNGTIAVTVGPDLLPDAD